METPSPQPTPQPPHDPTPAPIGDPPPRPDPRVNRGIGGPRDGSSVAVGLTPLSD
jgi:hypothetical protein